MHMHIDPIGGISGDMFVGALIDFHPESGKQLPLILSKLKLLDGVTISYKSYNDSILTGTKFEVSKPDHGKAHHTDYGEIQTQINLSSLSEPVKKRSLHIFRILAEAEGKVHGCSVEKVRFHEVGAWDSIVDIVAAAFLIETLKVKSWSVSAVPLGSGRVKTAHGYLPIPAPAVTVLLEGVQVLDDGISGERVTPTGAAILKSLKVCDHIPHGNRTLKTSGYGFGSRKFKEISNVLRVLSFEYAEKEFTDIGVQETNVAVLRFEIDDQTSEDLATGLDNLRANSAVIDVIQTPVYGKKGRLLTQVQVLTLPDQVRSVIKQVFSETSTLGVRHTVQKKFYLERQEKTIRRNGQEISVKIVQRPDGSITGKAEMDQIAQVKGGAGARTSLRRDVESLILKEDD